MTQLIKRDCKLAFGLYEITVGVVIIAHIPGDPVKTVQYISGIMHTLHFVALFLWVGDGDFFLSIFSSAASQAPGQKFRTVVRIKQTGKISVNESPKWTRNEFYLKCCFWNKIHVSRSKTLALNFRLTWKNVRPVNCGCKLESELARGPFILNNLSDIVAYISNYTVFCGEVITHPCPNFNGGLTKSSLELEHRVWLNDYIPLFTWVYSLIHAFQEGLGRSLTLEVESCFARSHQPRRIFWSVLLVFLCRLEQNIEAVLTIAAAAVVVVVADVVAVVAVIVVDAVY